MKPFDNFNPDYNGQIEQFNAVREFATNDRKILILAGTNGTGKSHLAVELCKLYPPSKSSDFMSVGMIPSHQFISARQFYFLIREDMYPGLKHSEMLPCYFRDLFSRKLIVIDDLGTEPGDGSDFRSGFQYFLDEFKNKLVITTNRNKNGLAEKYGQSIMSRLSDRSVWLVFTGNDFRGEK